MFNKELFMMVKRDADNAIIKIRKMVWDANLDLKTKEELVDQSLQCLARLHKISITLYKHKLLGE